MGAQPSIPRGRLDAKGGHAQLGRTSALAFVVVEARARQHRARAGARSRSIRSRMRRNSSCAAATSAIWNRM